MFASTFLLVDIKAWHFISIHMIANESLEQQVRRFSQWIYGQAYIFPIDVGYSICLTSFVYISCQNK